MSEFGKTAPITSNVNDWSAPVVDATPAQPQPFQSDRDLIRRFQLLLDGNANAFKPGDFVVELGQARVLIKQALAALNAPSDWDREHVVAALAKLLPYVGSEERLAFIVPTVPLLSAGRNRLSLGTARFLAGSLSLLASDQERVTLCNLILEEISAKPELRVYDGSFRLGLLEPMFYWADVEQKITFLASVENLLRSEDEYNRRTAFFFLRNFFTSWSDFELLKLFLPTLWSKFDLALIEFADGGMGYSAVTFLLGAYLYSRPESTVTAEPVTIEDMEFTVDRQGASSVPLAPASRIMNRSRLSDLDHGQHRVEKRNRAAQEPAELVRELQWARRLAELKLPLKSRLIEPLELRDGKPVVSGSLYEQEAYIGFKAPKDYYRYINDADVSDEEFYTGLFAAIHDIFLLRNHGIYHTVPIALYHDAGSEAFIRPTSDFGRYVTMPDLRFQQSERCGMGDVDAWRVALKYPNIGVSGLRDFEELATLEEIRRGYSDFAPQLKQLLDLHENGAELADALLMQNALLAGLLLIGERFVAQANPAKKWQDETLLAELSHALLQLHTTAYAVRWAHTPAEASEILGNKVDWKKLARQVLFFMSDAYIPFVREGAAVENFPEEIYGPRTRVRGRTERQRSSQKMGPYRASTFDSEQGFLGTNGSKAQASLGPVNGPFPIREFERAMSATLINWKELETKTLQPVNSTVARAPRGPVTGKHRLAGGTWKHFKARRNSIRGFR